MSRPRAVADECSRAARSAQRMTDHRRDEKRYIIDGYRAAAALIEEEVLDAPDWRSPIRMRVTAVYKGYYSRGQGSAVAQEPPTIAAACSASRCTWDCAPSCSCAGSAIRALRLNLGAGQGVRDLAAVRGGVLVLSGPERRHKVVPNPEFFFWEPGPGPARLVRLGRLDGSGGEDNPESITVLEETDRDYRVLVLWDGDRGGRPMIVRILESIRLIRPPAPAPRRSVCGCWRSRKAR